MPELYALLIGVDFYFPNFLPEGSYGQLYGCVSDIDSVEAFLRDRLALDPAQLQRLTASHAGEQADRPAEDPRNWPTYENLVAAFGRVTSIGEPGDHVYIHYSGHGGRVPTLFPELKGESGWDETLVPTNVGDPGCRHLRDLELATLLRRMVDKGLVVTVVLDSCHSGGATRAAGKVRGIETPDTTPRPTESLVAPRDELAAAWRPLAETRDVDRVSGWLPEPEGYVLLAACRPSETAHEDEINGRDCGALTGRLVPLLEQANGSTSYREIHQRIVTAVHARFSDQTPMLQGEADRVVFGADRVKAAPSVAVLEVRADEIVLGAGQAHGIGPGATFAIDDSPGFGGAQTLSLVEVVTAGGTTSVARILRPGTRPIGIESRATLVRTGSGIVVHAVEVVASEQSASASATPRIEALNAAIQNDASGFVTSLRTGGTPDWRVLVGAEGHEVIDRSGALVPLLPGVPAAPASAFASELVRRLIHVSRFRSIALLDNVDTRSSLAGRLVLEAIDVQSDYEPGALSQGVPVTRAPVLLKEGEWLHLAISNRSQREINVALFDLSPSWEVRQIFPAAGDGDWWAIGPGEDHPLVLQASIATGLEGPGPFREVLKAFATFEPTSFRWLQLPAITALSKARASSVQPSSPLETLFAALGSGAATRDLSIAAASPDDWSSASLEIEVAGEVSGT
jgi:hypothetical protein